jgi:hemerythrin-like domain-containing protein
LIKEETMMAPDDSESELVCFFTDDHRDSDALWVAIEAVLDLGDSAALDRAWQQFDQCTRRHLAMEEEVLFPAFERMSGTEDGGPTAIMRQEHQQIRALLDQIGFAIGEGDTEQAFDLGDTLQLVIQQHNIKEEGMLYPMAGQILREEWADLRQELQSY